jgi:hypothetical protein
MLEETLARWGLLRQKKKMALDASIINVYSIQRLNYLSFP